MNRVIELEGVDNVRDLGGLPVRGGREVERGLLFRGASLAGLTAADEAVLFGRLGVSCVIDLRCGWERDAAPDRGPAAVPNLHIPFYDREKVGIEYTEGTQAGQVVGRDVPCDPDRFYRSLANPLTTRQMRAVVAEALGRAERGLPVYFHCSGGKDRAGITALLVLVVLGAEPDAVLEDYLLTNVARDRREAENLARFTRLAGGDAARGRQLTTAHRARPENLRAFHEAVVARFGGMEAFIADELGIGPARRDELRRRLTRPAADAASVHVSAREAAVPDWEPALAL